MNYSVVEARRWHVGQLSRRLRAAHRTLLLDREVTIHRELAAIFDASVYRKAAILDGRVAALWGVTGTLCSSAGYVWLALADDAVRHPFAVVREAKLELASIMESREEIATTILAGDDAARRFALFLGFHAGHDSEVSLERQNLDRELERVGVTMMGYRTSAIEAVAG